MPEQSPKATCKYCDRVTTQRMLKAAPDGGAICIDWFKCQQRRDTAFAKLKVRLGIGQRR